MNEKTAIRPLSIDDGGFTLLCSTEAVDLCRGDGRVVLPFMADPCHVRPCGELRSRALFTEERKEGHEAAGEEARTRSMTEGGVGYSIPPEIETEGSSPYNMNRTI